MANKLSEYAEPNLVYRVGDYTPSQDLPLTPEMQIDENARTEVETSEEWQATLDEVHARKLEESGAFTGMYTQPAYKDVDWRGNLPSHGAMETPHDAWAAHFKSQMKAGLGELVPGPAEGITVTFPKLPKGEDVPSSTPEQRDQWIQEWIDKAIPDQGATPFATGYQQVGKALLGGTVRGINMFVVDPVMKFGEAMETITSQTPSDMPPEASTKAVGALVDTGIGVGTGAAIAQRVAPVGGSYVGMFGGRNITGMSTDAVKMKVIMDDADLRLDDLLIKNKNMTPPQALKQINKEIRDQFPEDVVKKLTLGADGKIRFEFSDAAMKFKYPWEKIRSDAVYKVDDIVDHSVLKKYNPEALEDMTISIRKVDPKNIKNRDEWHRGAGSINYDTKHIYVEASTVEEARGVLIHEFMHKQQDTHELSIGSNVGEAEKLKTRIYNDLVNQVNRTIDKAGGYQNMAPAEKAAVKAMRDELNVLYDTPAEEIYRRVGGENEAESARIRDKLSLREREMMDPEFHEPRDRSKQIITYDGRTPMMDGRPAYRTDLPYQVRALVSKADRLQKLYETNLQKMERLGGGETDESRKYLKAAFSAKKRLDRAIEAADEAVKKWEESGKQTTMTEGGRRVIVKGESSSMGPEGPVGGSPTRYLPQNWGVMDEMDFNRAHKAIDKIENVSELTKMLHDLNDYYADFTLSVKQRDMINVTRDIIGDKMDDLQKEFIKQLERRTDEITDDPTVMLPDYLKQVDESQTPKFLEPKVPTKFKSKPYLVVDNKGKVVGAASSRVRASRSVDRRDNEYGGYKFRVIKNPDLDGDKDG